MLMPKRTKFRKQHKGRIKGDAKRGAELSFGTYGLKALTSERVNSRQIEAARRVVTRTMKRQGKLWIRIFPDLPVTSKAIGVRQGKGKGSVDYWACRVKPGRVIFELDGVSLELAEKALVAAAYKLPVKCKFVARREFE